MKFCKIFVVATTSFSLAACETMSSETQDSLTALAGSVIVGVLGAKLIGKEAARSAMSTVSQSQSTNAASFSPYSLGSSDDEQCNKLLDMYQKKLNRFKQKYPDGKASSSAIDGLCMDVNVATESAAQVGCSAKVQKQLDDGRRKLFSRLGSTSVYCQID